MKFCYTSCMSDENSEPVESPVPNTTETLITEPTEVIPPEAENVIAEEPILTPLETESAILQPEPTPAAVPEVLEVEPLNTPNIEQSAITTETENTPPVINASSQATTVNSEPVVEQKSLEAKPAEEPKPDTIGYGIFHLPRQVMLDLLQKARVAKETKRRKKLDKIMTLYEKKKNGSTGSPQVTNDIVEKLLHVSNSTATNYLNILEKEGRVKQVGLGRGTAYIKI